MKEQNYYVPKNYYAYSYDESNNVYLIRGVEPDYYSDQIIDHIPEELIENLVFEEYIRNNRVVDVKNNKGIISYSKNHCYALVDFNGRHFTEEQVMDVVYGRKVKFVLVKQEIPVSYSFVETEKDKPLTKRLINKFKHDIDNK